MYVLQPTKAYHIFFEHRPEYLYVNITADNVNIQIAKDYWTEILKMLYKRGYNKVLIEKNIPEKLTPDEVVELVGQLANSGCTHNRFAIFDTHFNSRIGGLQQQAANDRGLKLSIVGNFEAAESWLTSSKEPVQHEHDLIAELSALR